MTKRVLVTGAASGIGQAQMRAFCRAGYEVFAVDKDVICEQQDNLRTLQLDVTSDLGLYLERFRMWTSSATPQVS